MVCIISLHIVKLIPLYSYYSQGFFLNIYLYNYFLKQFKKIENN